jgi:hypothetical protein
MCWIDMIAHVEYGWDYVEGIADVDDVSTNDIPRVMEHLQPWST